MQALKQLNFNFLGVRKLAFAVSLILLLVSVGALVVRGLNVGIDFTGGLLVEVSYPAPVELDAVRSQLANSGFGDAVVQHFGTVRDVLLRLAPREDESVAETGARVISVLNQADSGVQLRRQEFVGPQVGDKLAEDAVLAMIYALIGILIYVSLRFQYRFAFSAVAALVHDVLLTLGVFSLLQLQFDLTVVAAVLAVVGYSLNDTIVVFDRIRENFRKMRKGTPEEVINSSINQTLSRTVITSGTTVLVLLALYLFGGAMIHNFALALLVGIVVGTYSSIYIASAMALQLGVSRDDLMPVQKEGADLDNMP